MTSPVNVTREKLVAGDIALGVGVRIARTIDIVLAMKTAGFDWLFIDLEHGALSIDTASQIATAALKADITPIARVPSGDFNMATRLLDNGALGLVMPHVDTAEEAESVARHLRFPPQGTRSVFGGMPHFGFAATPVATASETINRQTLLAVMLETPAAIENADAIAAVDGIDILFIGTNDLCAQMGISGNYGHPSVRSAYQRTIEACRTHGKWAGMGGVYDPEIMAEHIKAGVQFVLGGSDLSFMMSSASQKTKQLRQVVR
jgi:4-hydroxy-2-oxoheptanedioate aldolase